jgi:pimeloyl-ACP methyl ester carboxylesterase
MTSHITSRHLWRGAGAASLVAVILIAGAAQAAGDPVKPSRFKIDWSACEKSPQTQCGTLRVPIDWSKPSGATVSLAVARRPAKDQRQRVGTLFFGVSYGTQLGANYAQLYPTHTRAMVLDAALEHSLPEVYQVAGEIMAAEESFNRFADWCPTADTCALRGQDVRAVFDRLVVQADQNPIPAEGALRAVTGEDIRMGTKGLLRFKEPSVFGPDLSWAGLSRALQKAIDGDGSAFAVTPAGVPQYGWQSLFAVACLDYVPQVHTYQEMQQRLELGRQLAPHLQGASETWMVNLCIDWPVKPANPPRTLHVRGVPTLIIHAVHDPSDPYSWAHGLAAQIDASALLTRTGDGHTSVFTSDCAKSAMDAFLIERRSEPNRICEG